MNDSTQALLARVPTSSFIGGAFTGGTPSLPVLNPNTGGLLTSVVSADAASSGLAALDAACAAQESWAATTPRERSEILRRAYELVVERADDFARLMTLEMGKPIAEAYGEVTYGAEFLRWFSEEAVRTQGRFREAPTADGQYIMTVAKPVGPSLLITPWNFPLSMGTRKVAPALAAGCTVILKPASQTPLTSLLFMEILREAGVPAGVVNCVVTRDSSTLSSTLLADPRLRKLSFTGSTEVGRTLERLAADHVLRTSMELGGNAPFLILETADLDKATDALMAAKFRNNGQACTAANRIFVLKDVASDFEQLLAKRVRGLVVGDGNDDGTTLSALINADAVEHCSDLVADAVDRGARVVVGGPAGEHPATSSAADGFFFSPTVLADVPSDARVCSEEIFGPVAPIVVCDSVEQMVKRANDTEFGLVAYACAESLAEITAVVPRLEAGMVAVNAGVVSDPAAPFGGVKESGLGREGSHEGLAEFQELIYVRIG